MLQHGEPDLGTSPQISAGTHSLNHLLGAAKLTDTIAASDLRPLRKEEAAISRETSVGYCPPPFSPGHGHKAK